ncbi:PhzF family phenazine biosynthesis protein [Nocardia sp. CDC159]|uniref:PhzF family phenazine biosynthesis protein n=2 Tax=Nocardia pulmonis TaxID=2951408 RepID=A0A9X2J009_9NOCA|nr:PhzF family phenazine biosynthesis protein [Nocardia sp. CDC159]MCM6777983.1 PhzF family phenazine biosynthesis protein [Nocardia pulmonis]MCM6790846.1 PhzF family phenazine biosynthesis protein [Nocardia sp. CDC159]
MLVHACQRAGRGGSPTVVADETPLSDSERCSLPGATGASHGVFLQSDRRTVSLRFFTAAGELPACGHGTVAALAALAHRARVPEYDAVLCSGGRTFRGRATGDGNRYEATFDPGPVELGTPTATASDPVLTAVGIDPVEASAPRIASLGRPRMLVQVPDHAALTSLRPDMARLRDACDRLGLLGCYVYSTPTPDGHATARMFAPSIGVPEDVANANSTACLAAHLADHGFTTLRIDMGDSLGRPSTITATTRPGPRGPLLRVGGTATILGPIDARSHT